MRLGTRLFVVTSLLVAATVIAVMALADGITRRHFQAEVAAALEREARLVAQLVPRDSSAWPESARVLGGVIGHRVTLIAPDGRVRGDAEFDRPSLQRLENHLRRPEVQAALATGAGRAQRRSASTNQPQMYVAVGGGPPGLAVVRVSATLASVDAQIGDVRRAVALAGLAALLVAAAVAGLASRVLARPLSRLEAAAHDIALGRAPDFPDSNIPEIARHIVSLRVMAGELERRFADLEHEREETAMLIEAMQDGVLAADARGRVTAMNSAARRLLGYGSDTDLPLLMQLFHDKQARELVAETAAGHEAHQRELTLANRSLLATGRRLPDDGSLLVLRDITELRRLETVRRDFVANVSHELKTPLTSIAGYAETLVQETPAGPARGFAETILKNAQRMHHLVDDLLDLSRIESGGWSPRPQALVPAAAAREAWAPFEAAARRTGIGFEVEADSADGTVWADPDALGQVFANLFDNAIRYAPGGRIRVASTEDAQGTTINVSDTGQGIPPEHLARIFERFYRADPARSREAGGTGLGLAIVKHLVEAHGGRVQAESTVGLGTTVRVWFPPRPPGP